MFPVVSCPELLRCQLLKKKTKLRTVCSSVGTFKVQRAENLSITRYLKTLHLTYLGMLHMLYYMKENCKLLLLRIMLE